MVEPYTISPPHFLDETKSLACIHCGLCLSSCPTYLETGNENDSPRGRIYLMRALQAGRLPLADPTVRHLDLCLGCRACEAACPSGVHYGELLETTRDHIERHHPRGLWQWFLRRVVIERVFPHPRRLRWALLPVRWIRALKLEPLLPRFARDSLALLPARFDRVALPEQSPAQSACPKGKVGMIRGCVMEVLFGPTNAATLRLLNRAGYDVVVPPAQGCCGALFVHGGNLEEARQRARKNIAAFERFNLDAIIINAAGCGSTLKEYGHLLRADPLWAERASRFSAKVKDLTEWLAQAGVSLPDPYSAREPVTYHDACHLAHPQGIIRPPRALIRHVAELVELPESDVCCGSAGSYNLTEPAMAQRLQQRKAANILRTGARVVITTNPGCILQIRAGLHAAGAHHVQVMHLADYLDSVPPAPTVPPSPPADGPLSSGG